MKKIFKRLCVTVLSFLMVVSSTALPAFGEDINYNDEDINYNERNDIANSFRYSNGHVKKKRLRKLCRTCFCEFRMA